MAAATFEDVAQRYLSMNGKNNKSWPETRRILEVDAIPALGKKPMAAIGRGEVAALIDKTDAARPRRRARIVCSDTPSLQMGAR